jgi:cobalt-zinc-cadmium resistance protein CzcA
VSQSDLRTYAETVLRQELSAIPGVSNLLIMGGSTKQYTIALDPQKIAAKKLALAEIEKSLENITNPG